MQLLKSLVCLILVGFGHATCSQETNPSTPCDTYITEFPTSFFFRTPQNLMETGFKSWNQEFSRVNGIITKAVKEEIFSEKMDQAQSFTKRYKEKQADQLVLLHLNGRSRDPHDANEQYFAGHWLYLPGCNLSSKAEVADSIIYVDDTQLFKTEIQKKGRWITHDQICLVPLNEKGEKDWYKAEQVSLISINHQKGYLVVKRGQFSTRARPFKKCLTYVAPHAHKGPFAEHLLWEYNMSVACPRDSLGRTAADVFVQEIANWVRPEGVLHHIDGIAFDVTDFDRHGLCKGRQVDINNDGGGDNGRVGSRNLHGEGMYAFFEQLRNVLGDDIILTADGHNPESQRAIGVLNGIESEGLCTYNDPYRAWSKTINYLNYWQQFTINRPSFNYIAIKDVTPDPVLPHWSSERFGMGTAVCLGTAFTESLKKQKHGHHHYAVKDETVCGVKQQKHWLGKPIADMQTHFVKDSGMVSIDLKSESIHLLNAHSKVISNGIYLEKNDADHAMRLIFKDIQLPYTDLFFTLEAIAMDSLSGFPSAVPHKFYVEVIGTSDKAHNASKLYSFVGTHDSFKSVFYHRNQFHQSVDVHLVFETPISVKLRDIRIERATPVVYREFENGVVVVNPSVRSIQIDVNKLFPELRLKRIKGTPAQLQWDPYQYNTGKPVENELTLEPVDAIFLESFQKEVSTH